MELQRPISGGGQPPQELLGFPRARPVADLAPEVAFVEDAFGQAAVPTYERDIVRAEPQEGAVVVPAVADVHDPLVVTLRVPIAVRVEFAAWVSSAAYLCTCWRCTRLCIHAAVRRAGCGV